MKRWINGEIVDVPDNAEPVIDTLSMIETEIEELKLRLKESDYQAIKYAEGLISEEDYAKTKAKRQKWRDRINELEGEINGKS